MQKEKEDLKLVSLDSLGDQIGDKETPEEKAQKNLNDALSGGAKKKDPLFLDIDDEPETPEAPEPGNSDEPEPKPEGDDDPEGDKSETPETPKASEESEEEEEDDKKRGRSSDEPDSEKVSDTSTFYKNALRKLFGESIETLTIEEDGEEKDISLEDLDVDEDYFQEIVQAKYDLEKQDALEGKVDITGNSDFAKKILDIDKAGGSYADLLEMKEVYTDPLSQLDFENPEHQKEAIFLRYKAKNNLADEEISAIIQGYERSGNLKEKSLSAKEEIEEAVNKAAEKREQDALEKKKELEQKDKEYRAKMKDALGGYELKDSIKEKLVNISTNRGEGGVYELDKIYSEAVSDPNKAAEIALYLLDREEFLAQVSSKKVNEANLNTAKKLKITGSKKPVSPQVNRKRQDKNLINLGELENK